MKLSSFCFLLLCFLLAMPLQAQDIIKSLESKKPGEGTVTIHQDPRIGALIGADRAPATSATTSPSVNENITAPEGNTSSSDNDSSTRGKRHFKTSGYRVQVFAGNNSRQSKSEAQQKALQVRNYLNGTPVYAYFLSPRWVCRVGDFKSIEEADAVMRKLKASSNFKEVSIVRDQINIYL